MVPERVLITGGAGFFGSRLVARARAAGARSVVLGRRLVDTSDYHALDLVADHGRLVALLEADRPQIVFHLAGGAAPDPFAANVAPLRSLLAAIRAIPGFAPRVVVAGSAAEYGDLGPAPIREDARENPVSEYGVAKLATARLAVVAARAGLPVTVARVFNALGPGMPRSLAAARFVHEARVAAQGSRRMTVGNLSTVRDYLDVDDVAGALWALGTAARHEPIVNVCSGEGVSTGALLEAILRQLGAEVEVRTDPTLLRGAADVPVSIGDPSLLREITGCELSFSLADAVRRMVAEATP